MSSAKIINGLNVNFVFHFRYVTKIARSGRPGLAEVSEFAAFKFSDGMSCQGSQDRTI